jgi:hypothetical protein
MKHMTLKSLIGSNKSLNAEISWLIAIDITVYNMNAQKPNIQYLFFLKKVIASFFLKRKVQRKRIGKVTSEISTFGAVAENSIEGSSTVPTKVKSTNAKPK